MRTNRPSTLWVVMVAVNRENRDSDVKITILIIDSWEAVDIAFRQIICREQGSLAHE